ncbi:Teichuronic acid biosynthesis protein TuaB [Anaerolineae bacterium]|nr:Teichuronic acid biosynthesis protein TuaB [Anaerolineae bacterium]
MADSAPVSVSSITTLTHKTIRGTIWTYLSFYGGKLMVFASTIILARLLTKEDFGVAGYAATIIIFLDVLADLGVGPALIFHRDLPEIANTAFWLGLVLGVSIFGLTWVAAPLAGAFFNDNRAIPVIRVLTIGLPIYALCNVHDKLLQRDLAFGRKFIPEFVKAISKGVISIGLALTGFGAWSLVIGQVGANVFTVIAYWLVLPWRPSLRFARDTSRYLLSYGLKLVSGNFLSVIVENIDYLFVGRYLGAAALGIYTLAFRLPELLVMQFCGIVSRVIFPVYASLRDDRVAFGRGFLLTTRYVALVTIPLGLGLTLIAEPLVLTLFTEKWIEAIPVIRGISMYTLFLSLAYNAGDVYKAQGRPEVLTQMAFLQGAILIPALWWAVTGMGTIVAVGWTHAVIAFIVGIIQLAVALRMLKTSLMQLVEALRPAVVSGLLMAMAVLAMLQVSVSMPNWVQLITGTMIGGLVYLGALWILHRDILFEAVRTLRSALRKR